MVYINDPDARALRRMLQTIGHEYTEDDIHTLIGAAVDADILISVNEAKQRYGCSKTQLDEAFQNGVAWIENDAYDMGWGDALDAVHSLAQEPINDTAQGG